MRDDLMTPAEAIAYLGVGLQPKLQPRISGVCV
jgi:hypothetical protein